MKSEKNRLSKIMAGAGVAARRTCETYIFAGRVKVNGTVAMQPQTMVDPKSDVITLDDKPISAEEEKVYFVLNKPTGYICSTKVSKNTKLVLDLFDKVEKRLFTVGRLDKDTSGLIIVTNDGHFANDIIHPSKDIQKEYVAKTDQEITPVHLMAIANGTLIEGSFTKPIRVKKVRKGTVKVVIAEGKKREVRILLENAGLKVLELSRVRIGGLHLGSLPIGSSRPMTEQDKKAIFE